MKKFSVIIPTIWKSDYLMDLLLKCSKSKYVGEIILIDNNPNEGKVIDLPKLIHIKETHNTFVNPAWNKGVAMASYENITLPSDDISIDIDEYHYYIEQLCEFNDFKNVGFIGMHSENYKLIESQNPEFELYENITNKGGWACIFSFHKDNWKPIPNQLKIWYGDNWIHMVTPKEKVLQLKGISVETKMSTSSDLPEMEIIKNNDSFEWNKILNSIKQYGKITY